jgi:two-component system, OmpR family, KDP operon response regulator KdpE
MTSTGHLILIVEDEPQIRHFLRTTLTAEGYRVIEAENGERGAIEAATHKPDLVMVDLGLPDLDGVEVVKRIRAWSALPILILSARSAEADKVAALDAGADDYVTKPFGVGELRARIRVALRHAAHGGTQDAAGTLRFGNIEVDLERRLVRADGRDVHLTPIEFRLLTCLAKHGGMVLTHRHLLPVSRRPVALLAHLHEAIAAQA